MESSSRALIATSSLLLVIGLALGQDFNGDGMPDILWRNKATGTNAIWVMNGSVFKTSVLIQPATDLNWKMAGAGFFNEDDRPDIVWQHQISGAKGVWLMQGTSYLSSIPILAETELPWKIVGAADFNADKKTDLVLQHDNSGEKALWLMDGAKLVRGTIVDKDSGRDWQICATGQFGGDETPDLVLRHRKSGALSVWIMNGPNVSTNLSLNSIERPDPDWKLVSAADFNKDGQTDLLWRHATVGLNAITFMQGIHKVREDFIQFERNCDWRVATQDMEDSRYRLEIDHGTCLSASASTSPVPRITLLSNIILTNGQSMNVFRRMAGATNWGMALETNLTASSYADTNVLAGERYEYQVTFNASQAKRAVLSAAIRGAPVESRGRLVLLVDKALAARYRSIINSALRELIEDLIGDGWTVVRKNVSRHDNRANDAANRANKESLVEIKALLREECRSGAKGVLIVGHVTIPYSGYHNADSHGDHHGAWPADMYYGDAEEWGDRGQILRGTVHPEHANEPGDGKFEHDFPPSNLEMFVGRVDFARLPSFRTRDEPTEAEAELVQQYFAKAHRYRCKIPPYPLAEAGVAYSYFGATGRRGIDAMIFENAQRNFSAFFPEGVRRLNVGDPYEQRTKSYLWGFVGGYGSPSALNVAMYQVEHTAEGLAQKFNEAPIAFYMMVGSYFGDWNLRNNFMRATLATPAFGLGAVWMSPNPSQTHWRFQGMGLGEPLGQGLLSTVNDNPPRLSGDNNRLLAIMGDPTLRLHILAPPSKVRVKAERNSVQLTWNAGESGSKYFVYRAPASAGPFLRLSPHPIEGTTFTDDKPSKGEPTYMVRALSLVTSGCGSYTNISQGISVKVQ